MKILPWWNSSFKEMYGAALDSLVRMTFRRDMRVYVVLPTI